ncbi:hypothetical protein BY996DRAFT_6434362 [Phakopsora pachyrhizi]|nr:hypothetical protein BY996DRAFT_6434362 [Phakopsora pachyrhizi]
MFYNQISTNEHTQPIDETSPPTVRSHYHLSRDELVRGIANRLIFSQVYIYVYLTMIILSLMTILVSILSSHCGSVTFYVLEVLINTAMILEVSIRLVAFGKKFWKSKLNILDCVITVICLMTMIILFWKGCQAKREEVLDVIILVVRNLIQFIRLALILRRSGKSIFTRIEPIDLEGVIHSADSTSLMLDMDDDEEEYAFGRQARFSVMNRPNNQSNPKDQVPFFADQD